VTTETPIRVLLIEDNRGDARLIHEMLRDTPLLITDADRLTSGLDHLRSTGADVVLLDLSLPDSTGLETFEALHGAAPSSPIVVLSGLADQDVALRAMQEGAQDYLVKGEVDGATILRSIRYAIERQRLEAARRELEQQRDEFFSSVSHDLRTPVASIKAAIGVVLTNEPPNMPAGLHRLLTNIDHSADELSELISDLLQVARLQAGRVDLWVSEIDLRELIRRAAVAIEPLLQARGQRLQLSLPADPVIASVDAEQLARVLRNLLGNAQKYGREQGTVTVTLARRATDEVRVGVADDGPGVPPEDRERIFERFYRASNATSAGSPGTGLGLAIARGLVALHGGRLWVESTLGRGSTFWISLPLDQRARSNPEG
jgi:signal transduction histidine kinase